MEIVNSSKKIYIAFIITCLIIISYGFISQLIYGEKIIGLLEVFSKNIFFSFCIINISYFIRYLRWRFLIQIIGFKIPIKRDLMNC